MILHMIQCGLTSRHGSTMLALHWRLVGSGDTNMGGEREILSVQARYIILVLASGLPLGKILIKMLP